MRRRDREETRREEIINIIAAADCCRLGLIDDDGLAYSVPLNFAFVEEGDFGIFYFHGAAQGKKIDLVNRSLRASFEMDTRHKLLPAEKACGHSYAFASLMGKGDVSVVGNTREKYDALGLLMQQVTGKAGWSIPEEAIKSVGVIKLQVTEWSCKVHV